MPLALKAQPKALKPPLSHEAQMALTPRQVYKGNPATPGYEPNKDDIIGYLEGLELRLDASTLTFDDPAAGLAGTTIGDFFNAFDDGDLNRYRHDAGPVATLLYTFPVATGGGGGVDDADLIRERWITSVSQGRPGELLDRYIGRATGDREGDRLNYPVVVGPRGLAISIAGVGFIALRDRINVRDGQTYRLSARFFRLTNPTDPSGATVRLAIRWLDANYAAAGSPTIIYEETLFVAGGLQAIDTKFGESGTISTPSNAVYAVPYIETFDIDGVTIIEQIEVKTQPRFADVADQVVVTPASDNSAYYPTFVRPSGAGEREIRTDADLQYNPGTNTLTVENIITDNLDAQSITLPPTFVFEPENIPEFAVARTFYVTMTGNDGNTGTSTSKPLRTIAAALAKMAAAAPNACITIVHPGEYLVPRNSVIPANCALYGYDLRVTKLILANLAGTAPATSPADRAQNMFLMRSGIKVRGFTFTGMEHEPYTFSPDTETGAPPTKGYAFAFYPGEVITRSPYIADCSALHDLTQDQLSLPIDRENANPLLPRGMGNLYADGSVLSPSSPLRSVVVDSFTAINPNGVAYAIVRNGFVQLVSVFTNWSRVGIWSHLGGQVTLANSNTTFGDYAFAATGSRNAIRIEDGTVVGVGVYGTAAALIENNFAAIVSNLMNVRYPANLTGWATFTDAQKAFTQRDTETLLKALIGDLKAGQDRGTQRFIKGLFDWNADYVFASGLLTAFLQSFDEIDDAIQVYVTASGPQTMITNLLGLIKAVLTTPATYRTSFVSVVEYASQAFSYSGAGVNYNALPFSQRGTAVLPDPVSTIVQWGGGRCYGTFSTERGDTYLGNDLRVDFARSTVEGQAFSRGVQNIALPLIISLG
jgi:hypothetical protein